MKAPSFTTSRIAMMPSFTKTERSSSVDSVPATRTSSSI